MSRRFGGLAVLGSAAAALGLFAYAALGRATTRMPEPPFPLPPAARVAMAGDAQPPTAVQATVVLYVTKSCRYCRAELARFGELPARVPDLFRSVRVVVVTPDPPAAEDSIWVPPSLAHRRVHDGGRAMARALGVRAVPVVLFVDRAGTVKEITVGEQPAEATVRRLTRLLETSPQAAASHPDGH